MDAKLTLKLDKTIIEKVKEYAEQRNISLSKMVEKYFKSLVESKNKKETKSSPLVEELSGIIHLDHDTDFRDDRTNYLIEKYK